MDISLEEELAKTEFEGKIKWETNKQWAGILIELAETERNYFYKQGKDIFVQPREGTPQERIPYCYACGTKAKAIEQAFPDYDGIHPFSGSGETRTESRFYCPTCHGEPPSNAVVRDIIIDGEKCKKKS